MIAAQCLREGLLLQDCYRSVRYNSGAAAHESSRLSGLLREHMTKKYSNFFQCEIFYMAGKPAYACLPLPACEKTAASVQYICGKAAAIPN